MICASTQVCGFSRPIEISQFFLFKIWLVYFFLNWNRNFLKIFVAPLATCFGDAKVGLAVLFCRFGALSGFCGLFWVCLPLVNIFCWCSSFSLRFCCACSVFLSTNSALVFIAFFLLWVFAVLFCRFCALFALLSLSHACLWLRLVLAWRSAFSLCSFCLCCSFWMQN